ncbi:MAG: glycosyl transferase group 1 [Planctomycetaceae bacterium]|nr:glycosyl transferase group 1 [Planctomycetaceae bacterium]
MRIVQLMPGTANTFYCQNCLRDAGMFQMMRKLGHDVLAVPLYLPMELEGTNAADASPLFFGGINVYLQQRFRLFRTTPRWVDRMFDSHWLLQWAVRRFSMTDGRDLAATTLSMLRGAHGRQVKELDRLLRWLETRPPPDVVTLSNALLLGVSESIKARLATPVVCLLEDEDEFLDELPDDDRRRAEALLAERAQSIDAFITCSRYYADVAQARFRIDPQRIHVVPNGLILDGYDPAPAPPDPPVVGCLARLHPDKGVDILIESFAAMKADPHFADLTLRIAGGRTVGDQAYVRQLDARVRELGLTESVTFDGNLDRPRRLAFLKSLSLLVVPARRPEAFSMQMIEAMAAGVPVVAPDHGAYPELIQATGGGRLCRPDDPRDMADTITNLLMDSPAARALAAQGRAAVTDQYGASRTVETMMSIYGTTIAASSDAGANS